MQEHFDDQKDDELLAQFFPKPVSSVREVKVVQPSPPLERTGGISAQEQGLSQVSDWDPLLKRSISQP